MTVPPGPGQDSSSDAALLSDLESALATLLTDTTDLPVSDLTRVVELAGIALGATSARMFVADYGLTSLQELGLHGPTGRREPLAGTLPGRCFASGEVITANDAEGTVWVPLSEGSERLGVLELVHPGWSDEVAERGGADRAGPGPVVDQQAPLHRCRPAGSAHRAAVAGCRDPVGSPSAPHLFGPHRLGERHPRAGVLDRR